MKACQYNGHHDVRLPACYKVNSLHSNVPRQDKYYFNTHPKAKAQLVTEWKAADCELKSAVPPYRRGDSLRNCVTVMKAKTGTHSISGWQECYYYQGSSMNCKGQTKLSYKILVVFLVWIISINYKTHAFNIKQCT